MSGELEASANALRRLADLLDQGDARGCEVRLVMTASITPWVTKEMLAEKEKAAMAGYVVRVGEPTTIELNINTEGSR